MFLLSDGTKPGLQHSVCESARPPGAPCPPWHHEHGPASGADGTDGAVRGSPTEDAPAGLRATAHPGGEETISWRGEGSNKQLMEVKQGSFANNVLMYVNCFTLGELRAAVRTKRAVFLPAGAVPEPRRHQRPLLAPLPHAEDAGTARDRSTVPDRQHGTLLQGQLTLCCLLRHLILIKNLFIFIYLFYYKIYFISGG